MLALLIPSFVPMMLAPSGVPGSAGSPPEILELLVEIVRSALNPRVPRQGEDWSMLGEEALGLLDAIIWHITPDLVQRQVSSSTRHAYDSYVSRRLTYFICAPKVLDIFADPKQPIWLTQRAARILALLASCASLQYRNSVSRLTHGRGLQTRIFTSISSRCRPQTTRTP